MKLTYKVNEKAPFGKNLVYAFQQLLAILAATVLVPVLVDPQGTYLNQASALIGAGVGTLVYLLFTKFMIMSLENLHRMQLDKIHIHHA